MCHLGINEDDDDDDDWICDMQLGRQQLSHILMCSSLSTIPELREKLFVIYLQVSSHKKTHKLCQRKQTSCE